MSVLYGYLRGDRPGYVTRASTHTITATLQTWTDRLTLTLSADGGYRLSQEAGPVGKAPSRDLLTGNLRDVAP